MAFFQIPFQLGFAVQNWSIKKCTHEIQGESESEETSLVAEVSNELIECLHTLTAAESCM